MLPAGTLMRDMVTSIDPLQRSAMVNDLPFTNAQTSLTRFMKHIQDAGVPPKVNIAYLKSVGFKSGNDSYLVPILKRIGFLSSDGVPQTRWRSYRDKQRGPAVLALGVVEAYADLFDVYPDAYRKDEEAIRNWIRSKTEYDEVKVGNAVSTFKTLCSLSDFAGLSEPKEKTSSSAEAGPTVPLASVSTKPSGLPGTPSININIELQLPPSSDGSTYDKFFEAMKKHLFPDARDNN
jgi:hypothetical protein